MDPQARIHKVEQSEGIPPLLTRPQAARVLSVGLRTLDHLLASGDLPVVRIRGAVRIRYSAIESFLDARESRQNPKRAKR